MGRLTVRLPDTLHDQLAALANHEGISLNQYIVYALTRQATLAYWSEEAVAQQRASFTASLESLGQATAEEIETVLAKREEVEPEEGLTPEVTRRLRKRIAERKRQA